MRCKNCDKDIFFSVSNRLCVIVRCGNCGLVAKTLPVKNMHRNKR